MGAAVPIRDDIAAEELRRLARQESDGRVACRLTALLWKAIAAIGPGRVKTTWK